MAAISARDAGHRRAIAFLPSPSGPLLVAYVPPDVQQQPELSPFVIERDRLAAAATAREPALRAQAQPIELHEPRGIVDPPFDVVRTLEDRRLGADQAQHHGLVLRDVAQRR